MIREGGNVCQETVVRSSALSTECYKAREVSQALCLDFEEEGFSSVIISETEDTVHFRINAKCNEEFQRWMELYIKHNCTCFNVRRVYAREKILFRKTFICLHGASRNTGQKKTYTG